VKIEDSTRLSFRLLSAEDGQILWELDQDPEVMHFINGGKPSSMEDIDKILIPRMLAYRDQAKGWGIWQVCDKHSQEYLGWILVRPMNFFSDTPNFNDLELGWRFFKKTWGNGYATEAAIAVKEAIAQQTDVQYVSALAVTDNAASIGVMKKMGMSFIKKYIHKDPIGDFDAVHYQMPVK
jgi:RimJ/RimL family protein N-acetyltransferase